MSSRRCTCARARGTVQGGVRPRRERLRALTFAGFDSNWSIPTCEKTLNSSLRQRVVGESGWGLVHAPFCTAAARGRGDEK